MPDVAAFADESPGVRDRLLKDGVKGCPKSPEQGVTFVGGTSAATPLVAGMIALLLAQQAKQQGLARPGFVPPMIYARAKSNPGAFIDIAEGTNALFGGSMLPRPARLRPCNWARLAAGGARSPRSSAALNIRAAMSFTLELTEEQEASEPRRTSSRAT